jgi:ferric-dicitrate binding protein FerR (iron transport regulator)
MMQHNKKEIMNDSMKNWKVPSTHSSEDSWNAIQAKISSGRVVKMPETKTSLPWKWIGVAAAASIAILFILSTGNGALTEFSSGNATATYYLPDSSVVILNAGSKIAFNPDSYVEERTLQLEGEAFFDVKKGNKFVVEASKGQVIVHGTSFTIKDRSEDFEVKCFSGKVEALCNGESKMLDPGAMARYDENQLKLAGFDTQTADWRSGYFLFEDASLDEVLRELERQFGIVIQHGDISGKYFSGSFIKTNATEALELISVSMGFQFKECGPLTFCLI